MDLNKTKRRVKAADLIYRVTVVSCITCFVFNTTVLVISLILDEWVFGYALCQLYALLSQTLVAGSAWVIALAALERAYKMFRAEDHDATFSNINVKILVYGIYLIFVILYTAPIYGWGEYSQYRGGLRLGVRLSPNRSTINVTTEGTYVETIYLQFKNETDCQQEPPVDGLVFNPANVAHVMRIAVEERYTCEVRPVSRRGLDAIVRFISTEQLSRFYADFIEGNIGTTLERRFMDLFSMCGTKHEGVSLSVFLQRTAVQEYADIHLPFQDIAVCSLDFSSVNPSISSWIPLMIATSTIMPYSMVMVCAVAIYVTSKQHNTVNKGETLCLLLSSLISPLLTVPYYYVNVCSNRAVHVNHVINVGSTVLYHASTSFFIVCRVALAYSNHRSRNVVDKHKEPGVTLHSLGSHHDRRTDAHSDEDGV